LSYSAFICGVEGLSLSADETAFLLDSAPCGIILFRRNCDAPEQVLTLAQSIRDLLGDVNYPILIDQEGGRVQRLAAPHWAKRPAARAYCDACGGATDKALEAAYWGARLIAHDLRAVGVNVNCAPVLDIPAPGSHDIVGDRAYGNDAATVAALGGAVARGYLDGGVLPVIKHIPGHGRANADSHLDLPIIDAPFDVLDKTDFQPFHDLRDMPIAMTAHVVFADLDAQTPASASSRIIEGVIRNHIGFDGLLMCDDVSMHALSGSLEERTDAVLSAGCDLALHCNGKLDEMRAVAAKAPRLVGDALRRYERAIASLLTPLDFDAERAEVMVRETLADFA